MIVLVMAALVLLGLHPAREANAAEPVMSPGDAVVTGFSGFRPSGAAVIPGGNLLDGFVINIDGPSAQIQSLNVFGEPPQGQLVSPGLRKQVFAREIGQVFPIALMEGETASTSPSILLGATSMFGLHIVKPDSNGDGLPERIKTGEPGAFWMPGMFADDKGGSPGAIWRVDGETGNVELFATIPGNSGPGLGDVVYDGKTRSVFVSDLDTGLIHRLDEHGQLIETFDHGVDGRPAKGLAAVSDDGTKADIGSAAFDVEKPQTWGYTQSERRVHGMSAHQGRLYYTADHKVWSIGIKDDGGFAGDARWELDVQATTPDTQLSDLLFDASGRLYVAERGAQRGSYDYSVFADAEKAEVKRYRLEQPDDPATESRWVPDPEVYAIGLPAEHRHSNGGIALGFPYDETGMARIGSCGQFLWTTGERLRAGEFAQGDGEGDPAANADVNGLQGNPVESVRPQNVPPMTSYFTDYDSFFGDPERAGHMGDVEIWQPCEGVPGVQTFGELPPWWTPPTTELPPDYPPEFPPPEYPYYTNLELQKRAIPNSCWSLGSDWICRYRIRIRNTGPDDYFGDIQIRDWFPANPPGLATLFQPQPPWFCWQPGGSPAETRCWRPNVFLPSGNSLFMTVWAKVPKNPRRCRLTNVAEIEWAPGGTQWNTDPTDDLDAATATIPDPRCEPSGRRSNLKLEKEAHQCVIVGNDVACSYHISVENTGPDDYFGPLSVHDQLPNAVTSFSWAPMPFWNCNNLGGGNFQCDHKAPVNVLLPKNAKEHLWISAKVPVAAAKALGCKLHNRARIVDPLGAPKNTDPTDDADSATAQMPPELCERPDTNLRLTKTASPEMCQFNAGNFFCKYLIRVINDGPGVYNGDLHVRDTFPAGTDLLLGPGPWTCDPPVGNTRVCKLNGVVMGPITARSFPVWLKVPPAVARDNDCRIRNRAKIIKAPGGTPQNTNPADDEDDAVSTFPADVCQGPEGHTNLKITKRAMPDVCVHQKNGFKCVWNIVVENTGPGPFNGNIILNETLPGEPLSASWNAPWNCVGAGGGGGAICTYNNAAIANGGQILLNLTTFFSRDLVEQSQCKLTNLVEIAQPAGGTAKNTDAADDTAQATASVDPSICRTTPPPPQPQQCPPGYHYDDGACVPRTQPPGPSIVPPLPPPPVVDDCPAGMNDVSSTRAHHLRRQGWTVHRYNGQWCVQPPREPDCPSGYEEVPQSRIDILRKKGWTITRAARGKWCGRPGAKPEWKFCPDGTRVPIGRRCEHGVKCWDGSTAPSQRQCPPRTHRCPDGSVMPLGRKCPPQLHTCWNGKKVLSPSMCPPRRVPCGPGFTGYKPNCKKIVRPCPPGTVGPGRPNCKKIVRPCPPGTVGPGRPNCRKVNVRKPCPRGTIGKYQPHCKAVKKQPHKPIFKPGQKLNLR
ncbi:MAG: hypothetical protein AB7U75_02670 [Hyphomicrobiaceae bacterium]